MTDSMDLNEIAKRPARYWNRDGLVEVFVGLMMLVPAGLFGLAQQLPKGSWFVMLAPVAWIVAILALRRGLTSLKEKVVAPRSGYVKLLESSKPVRIGVLLAGVLCAIAFTLLLPGGGEWGAMPVLALSLLFAACFFAGWMQSRDAHLLALAGGPLLAGVYAFSRALPARQTLYLLLIATGTGLVLSGLVRLRTFLKENPAGSVDA